MSTTHAAIVSVLASAPGPMSAQQIADTIDDTLYAVRGVLRRSPERFVVVGHAPAHGGAHGGGKPASLYALAERAGAVVSPDSGEGPDGLTAADFEVDDNRETDDARPTVWVGTRSGGGQFGCTRLGQVVTFAKCLTDYVDHTALRRQSPCNGCSEGAERRREYAGVAP